MSKPVDNVATVRKIYLHFNPRGPWQLSETASATSNIDIKIEKRFGRRFCFDIVQRALEASEKNASRVIPCNILAERGL